MLGWIANFLILIALVLLGYKKRLGWIFSIIGNLLWCLYALQLDLWAALFIDGITMIIGCYNWKKWGDDDS